MGIDVAALAGLFLVLAAYVSYLVMLFVLHRFTYQTWLFHVAVIAGMLLALAGLLNASRLFRRHRRLPAGRSDQPCLRRDCRSGAGSPLGRSSVPKCRCLRARVGASRARGCG